MAHPAASEIQADSASLRGPIRVEFPESCGCSRGSTPPRGRIQARGALVLSRHRHGV